MYVCYVADGKTGKNRRRKRTQHKKKTKKTYFFCWFGYIPMFLKRICVYGNWAGFTNTM